MKDFLYNMECGERMKDQHADVLVIRVPGGWIFIDYSLGEDGIVSSQSQCFVPYSDEFKKG